MLLMLLLQVLACCLCYFTSAHAQVQVVPPVTLRPSFGAHNQRVSVLAYSPDGRYLASGSWDRVVKIWCNNEEQDEMELVGHLGAITALAWNVNSTLFVSGSSDQTLRNWDVRSGKPVRVLADVHQTISAIDWHPHNNEIAFGTGDGKLFNWNPANLE